MSDGMRRELAYLSSHATNRYFIPNWGYASKALGIKNPKAIIDKLTANKIIRFAAYKSQFILFEGTDINIEDELYKAATIVPVPKLLAAEIAPYLNYKIP